MIAFFNKNPWDTFSNPRDLTSGVSPASRRFGHRSNTFPQLEIPQVHWAKLLLDPVNACALTCLVTQILLVGEPQVGPGCGAEKRALWNYKFGDQQVEYGKMVQGWVLNSLKIEENGK